MCPVFYTVVHVSLHLLLVSVTSMFFKTDNISVEAASCSVINV